MRHRSDSPVVRVSAYSECLLEVAMGAPQRGIVHSTFISAANLVFPGSLVLSLNSDPLLCLPNGLHLAVSAGSFPFSQLRTGMTVLLGAGRLVIDSLQLVCDLSSCPRWNPYIDHFLYIDQSLVQKNSERLLQFLSTHQLFKDTRPVFFVHDMHAFVRHMCGRGTGLTPSGDDILLGWMAAGWSLYGAEPRFVRICEDIVQVAERQTHLLSRCWLRYAATGAVSLPLKYVLAALHTPDDTQLLQRAQTVLAIGSTSGYDMLWGVLLGLQMYLAPTL